LLKLFGIHLNTGNTPTLHGRPHTSASTNLTPAEIPISPKKNIENHQKFKKKMYVLPTNHVVSTESFNRKYFVFWAHQKR
jgi:hypothetical protein